MNYLREVTIDNKFSNFREKEIDDSKLLEYNIYYNNQSVQNNLHHQENSDYIKIEIDIEKLKQTQPSLPQMDDHGGLDKLIEVISKSIRVNNDGRVLVDSNKIDSRAVRVIAKTITEINEQKRQVITENYNKIEELRNILERHPDRVRNLVKTIKSINGQQYLFRLYKKESIAQEPGKFNYDVYEEYRTDYFIELSNLYNQERKLYELSLDECENLFGSKEEEVIIEMLSKKAIYFNDQIMLLITKTVDYQPDFEKFESRGFRLYYKNIITRLQRFISKIKSLKFSGLYRRQMQQIKKHRFVVERIALDKIHYDAILWEK